MCVAVFSYQMVSQQPIKGPHAVVFDSNTLKTDFIADIFHAAVQPRYNEYWFKRLTKRL